MVPVEATGWDPSLCRQLSRTNHSLGISGVMLIVSENNPPSQLDIFSEKVQQRPNASDFVAQPRTNARRTAVKRRLRKISQIGMGLLAIFIVSHSAGLAQDGATKNSMPCVRLLGSPTVTINQATGEGTTNLDLRNQTDKEVSIALVASVSSQGNSPVYATFESDPQTQPKRIYEKVVPPKTTVSVRLIVHEDWDDAELDLEIANHYGAEKIGKVHLRRWH
jgi:hypothetical protein